MTRALILAAGFGSRLGALSDERPKPLLPVADVPLIEYSMALLRGAGILEVVVNLHHRGEMIEAALAQRVRYSREPHILGTGGGIRHALPLLDDKGAPFLVVNGKILIDLDVADLLRTHRASGAAATLVVREDPDAQRWNAIDAPPDGGPIRSIFGAGSFMFTGIHVIEPSLVARFPDDDQERCIVRQGYVPWIADGVPIHAYVARGYFMEHSTPARYLEGNRNVLRGLATIRHPPGPLTGVDATARVHETATIIPPVRVGPRATIGAGATIGPDTVIGTNATVAPRVSVVDSVVWPDSHVDADAAHTIITPTQRLSVGTS
jgi:NDP-sugar pyrophosphorylase family protein